MFRNQICVVIATAIALTSVQSALADTLVIWDPVNAPFITGQGFNAVPTDNNALAFEFDAALFANVIYTPSNQGGGPAFPSTDENNGVVRVTAMALPGNAAGAVFVVLLGEPNMFDPPGMGIEDRRELFAYTFLVEDFGTEGFTSLEIPVSSPSFINHTDLNGGTFTAGPLDGVASFDKLGLDLLLLQSPTNDGVNTTNPGAAIFELLSIELCPSELLLGDVNLDGEVNLLDVTPFVDLLTESEFQAEADIDQNGTVDLLDVAPFVELLTG